MTRATLILICVLVCIISCKVAEKDMAGLYRLDGFPKTILKINSDKTFEFSKNNRNPYLHPFDHPDEYYFDTKGSWRKIDKKTISLTSQTDTLVYPLVSIETFNPKNPSSSQFTFYDTYGDTVKVLYVQYSNNSITAALHRSMDYFAEDLTKRDTLEFHFYGYRPYTFISGQKTNKDYNIILKPGFQPNFFIETMFSVKRKKLIDIKRKGKFRLTEKI
ncbi:MAG: hypothetical protein QM802_26505 [Agriterribacter sp.]